MLQETVTWDPQNMIVEPSIGQKIYVLFLVVVCVVTIVKLIRIWRVALPFRLSTQANNPSYLKLLRICHRSLCRWIGCIFLAWAILSSTAIYNFCHSMLGEKVTGRIAILFAIRDFFTSLSIALWFVLFIFVVRWHVSNRIERLRD